MEKIIIVGPADPYRGGNVLFAKHLYQVLSGKFQVKFYNYKLLYPSFLFPGTTQYDESKSSLFTVPNIRVVNSLNPFNWVFTAIKLIKENADLIIFNWWHPYFSFCHFTISLILKIKYKNKIIFSLENVISHEGHFIDKILTRIGLSNASAFLTLSDKVSDELKELIPSATIYKTELPVYDCYDLNRSTDSAKEELGFKNTDRVLLFFGYVRKYKGLDILIQALPKILIKIPDIKLLIVGEFYDNYKIYTDLIDKLQLNNYIKLINKFIPNEEVAKYYLSADVVVLPYRSATQSGILNVAYGFKKPVIVTNVGGLAEFVRNEVTGIIVQPNSPDYLADGILKFYSLYRKVNFESNISDFNKENKFNQLPEMFKRIIEKSKK